MLYFFYLHNQYLVFAKKSTANFLAVQLALKLSQLIIYDAGTTPNNKAVL